MDQLTLKDVMDVATFDDLNISEADVPDVIEAHYQTILEIDQRIQLANQKCAQAKELSDAQTSAKNIKNKTGAINSTQDAVKSIADAQISLAEAQKMLFLNQQKMADGMRFLLMLGTVNITNTRIVAEHLEAKLKNTEVQHISQSAKDELIGIIRLLREQEAAFDKQEKIFGEMSDAKKTIRGHSLEIEKIHKLDEAQLKKDMEHDAKLAEIDKIDAAQSRKDVEHDTKIADNAYKNTLQDHQISNLHTADREHNAILKKLKVLAWIGIGLGCVAIVLSIIALII